MFEAVRQSKQSINLTARVNKKDEEIKEPNSKSKSYSFFNHTGRNESDQIHSSEMTLKHSNRAKGFLNKLDPFYKRENEEKGEQT